MVSRSERPSSGRRGGRLLGGCGLLALGWLLATCVPGARDAERPTASLSALDGARFRWVETACVDGPLDLAPLGFERELFTEVTSNRVMMTFDTRIARDRCSALLVWEAHYDAAAGVWAFESPGRVTVPYDSPCGVEEMGRAGGMLGLAGEELEVVTFRSPWCRGFDARMTYRRVDPRGFTDEEQIRRYMAHFNRRDAQALSQLFSVDGILVEPFGRTMDGTMKRHVGRAAVAAWFSAAFAGSAWSALRLRDLQAVGAQRGSWVAAWDYMDSALAGPVEGRNLFVLADGDIFMTEVQLTTSATPAAPP